MKITVIGTCILLNLTSLVSAQVAVLQAPVRAEHFLNRDIAHQPIPTYRSGYVFSMNQSLTGIWVDHVVNGNEIEKLITLPGSFRVSIESIAISFDDRIAVSATAVDREGRSSPVIAWLHIDGSIVRIIQTSPFGARHISFTGDGSLWAVGVETEPAEPTKVKVDHDVMRQYNPEGELVRTLLPRLGLPSADWHVVEESLLFTSNNHVAFVSKSSRKWILVSNEGIILDEGVLSIPDGIDIYQGALTNSGRIFLAGSGIGYTHENQSIVNPIYEINRGRSVLDTVLSQSALISDGLLIGSENQSLVFHVVSGSDKQIIWSTPN